VKGAVALVSGYAFMAILAVPAMLPAADEEPVAPAPAPAPTEVAPSPVDPAADQGAVPEAEQAPAPAAAAPGGEVVEVPSARKQATHEVVMRNIKFVPKKITVAVGDTITWRNEDAEPHNAIAEDDSFRTGTFGQGESDSATISEPGSHPYFCSIHAGMKGTVVAGSGGGGGGTDGGGGGGGGGSTGGSGSSGTSGGSSSFGTGSSTIPGVGTGSTSSSSSSRGSLPSTGSEELWFALAGAWLLTVGAAVRVALAGAPRS
jgi:LPXTG-motif cell wall-anchored protein